MFVRTFVHHLPSQSYFWIFLATVTLICLAVCKVYHTLCACRCMSVSSVILAFYECDSRFKLSRLAGCFTVAINNLILWRRKVYFCFSPKGHLIPWPHLMIPRFPDSGSSCSRVRVPHFGGVIFDFFRYLGVNPPRPPLPQPPRWLAVPAAAGRGCKS